MNGVNGIRSLFKILSLFALLACIGFTTSCITTSASVTPMYATRTVGSVTGEIALGEVDYPRPKYGSPYSMGAVTLANRIDYFCRDSLKEELGAYGLDINQNARLKIDAEILQAETLWRKQGRAGVFRTTFAVKFTAYDKENQGQAVYTQIHQGSATHSQSYGGYPANASIVDALATTYERFLRDKKFHQILIDTRSINLYGEQAAKEKERVDYKNNIYRDYAQCLKDMSPDILSSLEPLRFEKAVFAIFGFKNREGDRNSLSLEIEREIRGHLTKNRFDVVTRELEEIVAEQELQFSDLFDENTRVDIGRLVGATHLLTGSLYYYKQDSIIKLRVEVVKVESGLVTASFVTNLVASQSYLDMLNEAP
jgi:hypothetical protein